MDSDILEALNLAHKPRWIEIDGVDDRLFLMCSNCGACGEQFVGEVLLVCPDCGAKMGGYQDEL